MSHQEVIPPTTRENELQRMKEEKKKAWLDNGNTKRLHCATCSNLFEFSLICRSSLRVWREGFSTSATVAG